MAYTYNNSYYSPIFKAEGSAVNTGALKKTIDTVQKTIETGIDSFVAKPNEDERKKKLRKRAIAVGSAVLVLGTLTMFLNPKNTSGFNKKLKSLQNSLDLKIQQSKDNFLKSKFYSGCKKVFGTVEKTGNLYFNLNSGKDVAFKSFCTNTNKKYPEFLTKNKTVHKIVKSIDDCFVKILKKPHEKITKWFDSISQYTVKRKYKNASKKMDSLESFINSIKNKLPREKQKLLDAKLQEIAEARKAFSNDNISKRFIEQEKVMQNLEKDLWDKIYTKENGFMKEPTKFWVQDALKSQKEQLQKNGNTLVEKLTGNKNQKGLYDEILDIADKDINEKDKQNLENLISSVGEKLKKANKSECFEYFDKKRDLMIGGAPTDIVTQIFGLGMCGWAVGNANKDERLQRALTAGLPVATGLASSLVFSALLYSGGVGLLAGAVVSGITSIVCYSINKHIFGNKDKEIDSNETQSIQTNNTQKNQEPVNV